MPPSWMIKLTEGWWEAKKDSKGKDNRLKKEEAKGEGERKGKIRLPADCSFREPVQQMDRGSDWCGWYSIDCYLPIRSMSVRCCPLDKGNMADLRSFDCALEEAHLPLSGLRISFELRPDQPPS